MTLLRDHARSIWQAAVDAADPFALVRAALTEPQPELRDALASAKRILVVGGGKAGAAMAAGVEAALPERLGQIRGVVNVPAEAVRPLRAIRLHAARSAGTNQPTAEGVAGTHAILDLVRTAQPGDLCLCPLSGGGSALLPAPADGLTLADKQGVTLLLHACGATIDEMNCVRKHLSAIKGGRLAQAFAGEERSLFSLIVSDVIGDPLDVIASGPTAADPTTFADALSILRRFGLEARTPHAVLDHLRRGERGEIPETLKVRPPGVVNCVIGNNRHSLASAAAKAESIGYHVVDLGSFIDGETCHAAATLAAIVRGMVTDRVPGSRPYCLLSGGETTVTLTPDHGNGGRNQEFVLAAALKLGKTGMRDVVILSGGTDGEDGPTDTAGAIADLGTLQRADALGINPLAYLERHDAYALFDATGDLLRTGLTGTNVMDVRVMLVGDR
jgi:hydroxypyruvate reductase/glycerate 2-kinase